ncbi:HAD family phosphatase [Microbacterium sediminis]|nr:HAD family phosphatase [Microbacterium sediminis]
MDGTIVDSEHHWIAAAHDIVRAHAPAAARTGLDALVGMAIPDGALLMRALGVDLPVDEIVRRQVAGVLTRMAAEPPRWRPGARELLAAVRAAGIPQALVTMSYRETADPVIAALPPGTFDVVVTGDDVDRGKPFPDAYLRAAGALAVAPDRAVAIEDSPTGLAAARAAGIAVIGVPHHVPLDGADALWPTLAGRAVTDLSLPPGGQPIVGIDASSRRV